MTENEDEFRKSDGSNFRYCPPNLRIRDHLSAPIINGGGDSLKMVQNGRISDFHGLLTLTLDPGMVITFFISHRVLPVYQISSKSKNFFEYGRTEICHP